MTKTRPIFIKNTTIYTENEVLTDTSILLVNGTISKISTNMTDIHDVNAIVIDGSELQVIPGFIDGHIHGANGHDVMDATEEALDMIAEILPQEGVTSFLATTITQAPESIEKALSNVAKYRNKPRYAELIGVHLEGPFVNEKKAGAQPKQYIQKPNLDLFKKWQTLANGKIKTITLATELDIDGELINYLFGEGINVSAGHTEAKFTDMGNAVENGVRQITHLCNAMNGIHHRDIGVIGAAFLLKELRAEIIADGVHISNEMLQILYNNIGSERLILITDAMRAKGLGPGKYDLGGQPVNVAKDRALLADGTLAGSILKMRDAACRMLQLEGVTISDVVKMTATNPAKQLGIDHLKGSIAEGKDADILLVDHQLNINYTICRGRISCQGK